jgi:hypothetical protein
MYEVQLMDRELKHVNLDRQEAYPLAEKYFVEEAHLDLTKPKHKKMYDTGMSVHEKGNDGIDIRAKFLRLGPEAYDGATVDTGGQKLSATAFERIPKEDVYLIYVYALTAGECLFEDGDSVPKQLHAHMWGTAYTDAGRRLLEKVIIEDAKKVSVPALDAGPTPFILSPAISPGFYGMPGTDSISIVDACEAETIGLSTRESGVMLPIKSCSGIFFITKPGVNFPTDHCAICIGTKGGCSACHVRKEAIQSV